MRHMFIGNGLKQPVTVRSLRGNGVYEPITDRFNLCNRPDLTSVTKNSCNGHLRRPLPKVHIVNGHCGGQPRGRPAALMSKERKTTTVTEVGASNGC
jgi:hypothetical protein